MVRYINIDQAAEILEEQLEEVGYIGREDYTLRDFLEDREAMVYILSGSFGRGFQLHKRYDDLGMYLKYTQYPEYETSQSFAWVVNRNLEWTRYRIKEKEETRSGDKKGKES